MQSNKFVLVLLVLLLIFSSVNVFQNYLIEQKLLKMQEESKNRITQVSVAQDDAKEASQEQIEQYTPDTFTVRGVIKKEKIPEELELGEDWYWIYFDEPYLLKNNASGWPQYVNKLQLVPPQDAAFYKIDDYLDSPVEIYGYNSWGYAESSIIQVISIAKL